MPVIRKVEELEDRLKVDFHFSNGMHINDAYLTKEIMYDTILSLQEPPPLKEVNEDEDVCPQNYWEESILVQRIGRTIIFQFEETQETTSSRMQSFLGGPYSVNGSWQNRVSDYLGVRNS
jgi:hypothetical protein